MMETFDCCWDRTALEKKEDGSPKMKVSPNMNWTERLKLNSKARLRKQPTFPHATDGFPAKWLLKNERKNSVLMMGHYADLGGTSDW